MRRIRSALVVLFLCTGAVLAGSPAGASAGGSEVTALRAAQVAAGPYFLQFNHSGRCLDNPGPTTANVQLDQWNCLAQTNEYWYLDYVFTDAGGFDFFRVRNAYSGKCVNVAGGSSANSAAIIQYPCGSYNNEYFVFWSDGSVPSGYFWVQAYHSGKVLNIQGGSTANGAKAIQYTRCYCANEYVALT
ncbi:RICIN domain-containing protein [Actinophytocola sp.]|uniref:RICIN domain-containing protein n=1 Tax=Actinophytocola sp. TaxID=1872138 RepID=UPI002EDAB0CB